MKRFLGLGFLFAGFLFWFMAGCTKVLSPVSPSNFTPTNTPNPSFSPTMTFSSTPTPGACAKVGFYFAGPQDEAVAAGSTITGLSYGVTQENNCVQGFTITDLFFSVSTTGNLNSKILAVQLFQGTNLVGAVQNNNPLATSFDVSGLSLNPTGTLITLRYILASDAEGTIQTTLSNASGFGPAGFSPDLLPFQSGVVTVNALATSTPSATNTDTVLPTLTPTMTPTTTFTSSWTFTATQTPSVTQTRTLTGCVTPTPINTRTPTMTPTTTMTFSSTLTFTNTVTSTMTSIPDGSWTPTPALSACVTVGNYFYESISAYTQVPIDNYVADVINMGPSCGENPPISGNPILKCAGILGYSPSQGTAEIAIYDSNSNRIALASASFPAAENKWIIVNFSQAVPLTCGSDYVLVVHSLTPDLFLAYSTYDSCRDMSSTYIGNLPVTFMVPGIFSLSATGSCPEMFLSACWGQ